jgi:uncharacterized protein (DUF169 family)
MQPNQELARQLEKMLALKSPPIALVFSDAPLPGVPKVQATAPAGCAYWKRAAEGELFYTTAEDHLGCAIGAFTHGASLGPDGETDLMNTMRMMIGLGYLSESDVAEIPRRQATLGVVTYGPLAFLPHDPDVVLLRVSPRAAMLLSETAHALGVRSEAAPIIRPACAMIPVLLGTARATSSYGCIGNRVYTELPDEEVWFAIAGRHIASLLNRLATVVRANQELESFHRSRLS